MFFVYGYLLKSWGMMLCLSNAPLKKQDFLIKSIRRSSILSLISNFKYILSECVMHLCSVCSIICFWSATFFPSRCNLQRIELLKKKCIRYDDLVIADGHTPNISGKVVTKKTIILTKATDFHRMYYYASTT